MAEDGSVVIKIKGDDSPFQKVLGKIGSAVNTAVKASAAAVGAASAGVAALGTACINAYADYEQLAGGVETLFKDSAETIHSFADNAYKTAGLSANEYMETVTSFSASLLQSLDGDTEKAAAAADLAITDMADNANKMGTAMESIQYAYQGFAKQNYTMLDNLKLGYGGTKEEMQRLLADAEKLSGVKYDLSSYADVVEAIHVIQTEMGITGTTAKEASTTIQGSVASMKAAWANLMVGMADDTQNFDMLLSNFIESIGTVADNLLPRIGIVIEGMGKLVAGLAPEIASALPTLTNELLPNLVELGCAVHQRTGAGHTGERGQPCGRCIIHRGYACGGHCGAAPDGGGYGGEPCGFSGGWADGKPAEYHPYCNRNDFDTGGKSDGKRKYHH